VAAGERYPWQEWTWDETVFAGTAAYYRKGRTPYAPGLAAALAEHLGLDGRGRLLDVGCGPGTLALTFAHLFESVVGLDPDPGMVAEATQAAAEALLETASWIQMRAEDLPGALGTFRVVGFAQSFHWMDRPLVAATVREMLDARGAVVQVDLRPSGPPGHDPPSHDPPGHDPPGGVHPAGPAAAIDELRRRWLGPDRRAGRGFRNTSPDREDEVFRGAGFAPEEILVVPDDRVLERSVDEVVAWVLSTSFTAPHLFGDRLEEFVSDLSALLRAVSPGGFFSVRLSDNRLRVHRPL
jgi:SAM-dependent methyltransferase